jgi:hypothetical protein
LWWRVVAAAVMLREVILPAAAAREGLEQEQDWL